jgi:hypothetical protein
MLCIGCFDYGLQTKLPLGVTKDYATTNTTSSMLNQRIQINRFSFSKCKLLHDDWLWF